jgi:hypothetical protein
MAGVSYAGTNSSSHKDPGRMKPVMWLDSYAVLRNGLEVCLQKMKKRCFFLGKTWRKE